MLFSQPEVAAAMVDQFECCWEPVREVPKATIDLGNGKVIERTLGGNVVTWFCMPDGRAFDVQPGLLDPASYRAALRSAELAYRSAVALGTVDTATSQLGLELQLTRRIARESQGWAEHLQRLLHTPMGILLATSDQAKLANDLPPEALLASIAEPFPVRPTPPPLERVILKAAIELPLVNLLNASAEPTHEPESTALERETELSKTVLRPQALGILSAAPLCEPKDLAPQLYRLVFATDLADPFLGMLPKTANWAETDSPLDPLIE